MAHRERVGALNPFNVLHWHREERVVAVLFEGEGAIWTVSFFKVLIVHAQYTVGGLREAIDDRAWLRSLFVLRLLEDAVGQLGLYGFVRLGELKAFDYGPVPCEFDWFDVVALAPL